jgi:hypothetical protein
MEIKITNKALSSNRILHSMNSLVKRAILKRHDKGNRDVTAAGQYTCSCVTTAVHGSEDVILM